MEDGYRSVLYKKALQQEQKWPEIVTKDLISGQCRQNFINCHQGVERKHDDEGHQFKKPLTLATKRRIATEIQEDYAISEHHSCRLMGISQNSKRYRPVNKGEDERITERLVVLSVLETVRISKAAFEVQREGMKIKRAYRHYKEGMTTCDVETSYPDI